MFSFAQQMRKCLLCWTRWFFFFPPLQAQGHPIYLEFCFLWRRVHKMQPCSVHLPPPCLTAAFCGGVTFFKPREGSQKWWCKCISFSFSFRFVLLKKTFSLLGMLIWYQPRWGRTCDIFSKAMQCCNSANKQSVRKKHYIALLSLMTLIQMAANTCWWDCG